MTTLTFHRTQPAWPILPAAVPARVLIALWAGVLLVLAITSPAFALDRRTGDAITVAAGQVVDDGLLASGRLVRIDGTVRGDLIAFARSVTVAGIVEGDVIA